MSTTTTLARTVRRLLRHPLMREVTHGGTFMAETTRAFERRYTRVSNAPRFALEELLRLARQALRMVEGGRRPWAVYERYCVYIMRALVLMKGLFCGRERPELDDTFCAICQSGDDTGPWWYSMACGHHFHVGCVFAHLEFDTRCPLCRVGI